MSRHQKHDMQLTSLYQYFPNWNEKEFNQKFRQQVKRDIIKLLQTNKNLTDREMAARLNYTDPNKVRPRRNELANQEYTKRTKRLVRDPILIEDTRRNCNITGNLSIAWKLSKENLNAYMNTK